MLRGIIAGGGWGLLIGVCAMALTSQLASWRDLSPALSEALVETPEVEAAEPEPGLGETPVVVAGAEQAIDLGAGAPEVPGDTGSGLSDSLPDASPPVMPEAARAPEAPDTAAPAIEAPEIALLAPTEAPDPGAAPQVSAPVAETLPDVSAEPPVPETPLAPGQDDAPRTPEQPSDEVPVLTAPEASEDAPVTLAEAAPAGPVEQADAAPSVPEAPEAPVAPANESIAAAARETEEEVSDPAPRVVAGQEGAAPAAPAQPDAPAPSLPDIPAATEVAETPQAPEAPESPAPEAPAMAEAQAPAPETPARTEMAEAEQVAPEPLPTIRAEAATPAAPEPDAYPVPAAQPEDPPVTASRLPGSALPGAPVRRLPRIGDSVERGTPDPAPAAAETGPMVPALDRYRVDFSGGGDAAPLAVVLIHGPGATLQPGDLDGVDVPVTVAMPAGAQGAASLIDSYRGAGAEVVLIPDLPSRPRAQDVEVSLAVALAALPGTVAFMDLGTDGFQSDRNATAAVLDVAKGSGHGIITYAQGFNSAQRAAEREGVPAGLVERELDEGPGFGRGMDQAAFKARQQGGAIAVATATPAVLADLAEWAAEAADAGIVLAPVSRVLLSK